MKVIGILVDRVEPRKAQVLIEDVFLNEGMPILNGMVYIPFVRQQTNCFAIGFITNFTHVNDFYKELELSKNLKQLTNSPVVNSIVMKKNFLLAEIEIVSAFSTSWSRLPIDTAIKTGTPVYKLENENLFLQTPKRFSYLGTFYGETIPQPLYLSDFQELGEAYHFCIAGQTGSGKSTLAKMLLSLYACCSKNMNFIIIDPVGEFSNAFRGKVKSSSDFGIDMRAIWTKQGRSFAIYDINNIYFDRWDLLKKLLHKKKVFSAFRIKTENKSQEASEKLTLCLKNAGMTLSNLGGASEKEKNLVCNIVSSDEFAKFVYAGDKEVARTIEQTGNNQAIEMFWDAFCSVSRYFHSPSDNSKKSITNLLRSMKYYGEPQMQGGKTLVFDLSSLSLEEEEIKLLLVQEICSLLYSVSLELYKQDINKNLNTLVVLDEAHNFAPPSYLINSEDLKSTAEQITKAFIETRKFGLGWMVISTRISNLERKLYEHSRVKILGFGLHTGSDRELIIETFGKDVIPRYSTLPEPTDPLYTNKEVAFLIDGPITVLSRQAPEFVKIFDNTNSFLKMNSLL